MPNVSKDAYRRAFVQYLRKGIPIAHSLAVMHKADTTSRYVWRTRGDSNVRTSHAENNGKIFSWDAPPTTGHPGAEYGCRCIAEPYREGITEYASQDILDGILDAPRPWSPEEFINHFYNGEGQALALMETGHQAGIINYFFYKLQRYEKINAQIINEARKQPSGLFEYDFNQSYSFGDYLYVFGGGKVKGLFNGSVLHENGKMIIHGSVSYEYSDEFTDPVNIRQNYQGNSGNTDSEIINFVSEMGGDRYFIFGKWDTIFNAEANLEKSESIYK